MSVLKASCLLKMLVSCCFDCKIVYAISTVFSLSVIPDGTFYSSVPSPGTPLVMALVPCSSLLDVLPHSNLETLVLALLCHLF